MLEKELVGYKFVTSDLKSKNGVCQWVIGEWKHHDGELSMCESGLHASPTPLDSLQYTYGDRWFIVAAKGILGKVEGDKFVCSDMKLVQEIPVAKVLVPFAIACALRCYGNWKKEYPKDDRVEKAILAAEKCFRDPSPENVEAAWSAAWSAARSAESAVWSAESAAWSAAWSAASAARSAERSAARSAESAAWSAERSAARSAESAAWSAASAARSAERSAARSAESAAWSAASAARNAEKQWQQRLLHRLIRKALKTTKVES
jgi:hypothetical protein